MSAEVAAEERETLDPADVLGDLDDLDALDAEIARVREREVRRLVRMAAKAGYFHVRIRNEEFGRIFREAFMAEPRRPSTLARLESRRDAHYAGRRARDARRKALLGGFVVAQCRHKPEVHARMVPEIRTWLGSHRSPNVGARNIEALEGFFGDPAHKGLVATPTSSKKVRRERTHRLILLGAWVLARRESVKELGDLVAAELARFLEQGQRADRHKALLKDVLGK